MAVQTLSAPRRRSGLADRLAALPYWLLATILLGIILFWNILSNSDYNTIFQAVSKGVGVTVYVCLVSFAVALSIGLVNQVFETREAMQAGVREMAALIASKSPLSIRGTKEMLNYSRDHSVADGLNYIATWNAAMLMSSDLTTAMMASMAKQTPQFKD